MYKLIGIFNWWITFEWIEWKEPEIQVGVAIYYIKPTDQSESRKSIMRSLNVDLNNFMLWMLVLFILQYADFRNF